MKYFGLIVLIAFVVWACKKETSISEITPYELKIPNHFPQMLIPEDNPISVEGVALGKKLFYDKKLSLDNSISCASCHDQKYAFSDPKRYSEGVNGTLGNRNSMALVNLGWQDFFFWDGRAKTLEEQILAPVPNPVEMHLEWEEAAKKINANDIYRSQFYRVFKTETIDKTFISKAISQFLRTLISATSKYDVMYKIEYSLDLNSSEEIIKNQISNEEWAGYDLFKSLNGADCFHCHNGPLMQVKKFSNNGLDAIQLDLGRELVTGNSNDRGKFKVPSLRNIALTAPYMHDGRFQTLDEVIEHYSSGIHVSPTIDPLIEYANQGGVQLDAEQKGLLKIFLNTLTDYEFVNNKEFSEE
ncbi:MAG: cytochrome c peroxidase [Bacteroidota bacterium]